MTQDQGQRICDIGIASLLPELPIGQWSTHIYRKSAINYQGPGVKDIRTHVQGVSQSLGPTHSPFIVTWSPR